MREKERAEAAPLVAEVRRRIEQGIADDLTALLHKQG
jgi:hypothetical protein